MDHLFLVDEVSGLVDELHQRTEMCGPLVEDVVGVFATREVDDAGWSIRLGFHCLVHHQIRQELFCFLDG